MKEPEQRRTHWPRWMWPVYAALFAVSIPWYWSVEETETIVWGWPRWALVSLLGAVVISGFTAYLALWCWPQAAPDEEEGADGV